MKYNFIILIETFRLAIFIPTILIITPAVIVGVIILSILTMMMWVINPPSITYNDKEDLTVILSWPYRIVRENIDRYKRILKEEEDE